MCGIAGIVGLDNKNDSSERVMRMSKALAHRGPDAEGSMVDDGVALAHRRLSIIDLSEAANQPLFDASGRYSIVFNGEIYNYREVRKTLTDHQFVTDSDTEVVLEAFKRLGPSCLALLNGMFAFAIWDSERKELFVARDRLGVKPLYYALRDDGVLIFASEIRSVLSSGLTERKISSAALYEYVMYQSVYAPRTIVEGINQLSAGTYGTWSRGKFEITSYWRMEDPPAAAIGSENEVLAAVRERLLRSVEMRMVSDVRLGAFLSGGIDSSAVVGLMSEVSDEPVDTFSVNFAEKGFDESEYSNLIAKRFNTRHTSVQLSVDDFLSQLPEAIASTDSPSGDGLNTYIVSKATKNAGIKVALSGLGGDELFAGYPNFLRWSRMRKGFLNKVPAVLRKPAGAVLSLSRNSKQQRLAEVLDSPSMNISGVYPMFRQVLSTASSAKLCGRNGHDVGIRNLLREKEGSIEAFPILSQFSIAEMLGYTQNVLLKDTDQFSMASALEVREPFFDYELVEYVLAAPDEIKYPKYPKSLLVEALKPMLPNEIVHRPKMGFVLPWEKWMRNELREFCDVRIRRLSEREILEPRALDDLWTSFLSGRKGVMWSQLWHLVVLADWLDANGF